ncbi:Uncharacterised protein [Vibrio cholerae]|nr:Uncharacterised protein [Vibrio cholerae]
MRGGRFKPSSCFSRPVKSSANAMVMVTGDVSPETETLKG